jgi:hypothetical protein
MNTGFQLGPRAQAAVVLALVAASGALAGMLGERLVAQQRGPAYDVVEDTPFRMPPGMMGRGPLDTTNGIRPGMRGPGGPGGPGATMRAAGVDARYAARLSTLLDLSAEQQLAIDSIMTEQRRRVRELTVELEPRFRAIAQDTRRNVDAVLTPEQLEQMRTMRQRRLRP